MSFLTTGFVLIDVLIITIVFLSCFASAALLSQYISEKITGEGTGGNSRIPFWPVLVSGILGAPLSYQIFWKDREDTWWIIPALVGLLVFIHFCIEFSVKKIKSK